MIHTANLTDSVSRKAGGLHESVRRLVQSLDTVGVGVRVLTVEDEFTQLDLAVWDPVRVDVFPRSWPKNFGYSPGFIRALSAEPPDLTHTHGIWMYPSIATAAYCTRRRVPYMISPHGMLDPWAVQHHRWKKVFAYALYESNHVRGARCIRALCESEARSIRKMKLKNPVAVIPNGIDLPETSASNGMDGKASWSKVVEGGKKVMLFLGRIHRKKGLTNLLKAWAENRKDANQKRGEWVLAIAGWDQDGYESDLKRLCSDLNIPWNDLSDTNHPTSGRSSEAASVLFLGPQFQEAKAACYRHCDAFILPSFSEGLPMAILESWAYGKPVLMTPECNLPEGFAAQAAFAIDTSVQGITEGLRTLESESDDTLKEMGRRGRRLVEERFTWSRVAGQVKTTYEWMLGSAAKPAWFFDE
jgi:glycosyltransferase involved in cell wall biosynthesis